MKLLVPKGATSYLAEIFIQDSSKTDGSGLTGLVFNTSGLTCYRGRGDDGNAGGTAITLATATLGTWATGGFKEKDATHMPGIYEIGITNASLASGSNYCVLYFQGAANMAPVVLEIQLTGADFGIAPGSANALLVAGTNAPVTITGFGNALTISSTGGNGQGLKISGNGSGAGFQALGGTTGAGIAAVGGATSGSGISASATTSGNGINATGAGQSGIAAVGGTDSDGISASGTGLGNGMSFTGGSTGNGAALTGGAGSGHGLSVTTFAGDGFHIAPTAGHGINASGNGTSMHGLFVTGGTAGTSDGIHASAGAGGVDIRGAITGSITGSLSGSVASVTARVTANTDQIAADGTAAINLSDGADGLVPSTCAAGSSATVIQTNLTQTVTDLFNGAAFILTSGTYAGARSAIVGYNGSTKAITVSPALPGAPASTDKFVIS